MACISGGCSSGAVLAAIRAGIKYICALIQRRTAAARSRYVSHSPSLGQVDYFFNIIAGSDATDFSWWFFSADCW